MYVLMMDVAQYSYDLNGTQTVVDTIENAQINQYSYKDKRFSYHKAQHNMY